jgi:hypothetical protein
MAYRDFTFPKVVTDLALTPRSERLFPDVPSLPVEPSLAARLVRGVAKATAIDTEKARSEFIIAPVLDEVLRLLGDRPTVFSGVEFNVDSDRGLVGRCDFLLSRHPFMFTVTAPLIAVAEGKNGITREGFGQCVAEMVAAATFNERAGNTIPRVYGASTNGQEWRFMRLTGATLTIDIDEYLIGDPGRLLGVLCHILEHG